MADQIISKILSRDGRENHDRIFRKQSAQAWVDELYPGATIYDPDGWREDGTDLETPINRADFERRFQKSTILGLDVIQD